MDFLKILNDREIQAGFVDMRVKFIGFFCAYCRLVSSALLEDVFLMDSIDQLTKLLLCWRLSSVHIDADVQIFSA